MADAPAERPGGRPGSGRFGILLLLGLASAGLAALASARAWFVAPAERSTVLGLSGAGNEADMPLALAFSLVMLAAWGVVLVTATRTRRIVLVLGVLAGLGVLAAALRAPFVLPGQIADQLSSAGARGSAPATEPTAWFVVAVVAVLVALATMVLGWRLAPRWPTMSSRYDAPGAGVNPATAEVADTDELSLWKALDEGRDPTQR